MNWKPIETAPTGVEILAWGLFIGEIYGTYDAPQAGVVMRNHPDGQWYTTLGDCYSCTCEATHWMPLPPPPNGQE